MKIITKEKKVKKGIKNSEKVVLYTLEEMKYD
jgi:hypothetical protein